MAVFTKGYLYFMVHMYTKCSTIYNIQTLVQYYVEALNSLMQSNPIYTDTIVKFHTGSIHQRVTKHSAIYNIQTLVYFMLKPSTVWCRCGLSYPI